MIAVGRREFCNVGREDSGFELAFQYQAWYQKSPSRLPSNPRHTTARTMAQTRPFATFGGKGFHKLPSLDWLTVQEV